jgi:hypothetical protein
VEIDVGGLRTARRPDGAAKAPLRVTLDGAPVFDLAHPFHPAAASEIFLGANPAGLSTAAPRFSSRILEAERIPAVR